jgi:hypothetical protein
MKNRPTAVKYAKIKKCTLAIKTAIVDKITKNEQIIIQSKNRGALYSHINKRLTHKAGIAPIHDSSGVVVTDDLAKAEVLNAHFINVGTVDDGVLPAHNRVVPIDTNISLIYFDACDIFNVIHSLDLKCSPGPDGIPCILVKQLVHVLCIPFAILFNLIFQFGEVPNEWKCAIVKPIFKKGNSSDPNNYRPISLTSIICKVYESIIKDKLLSYLNSNALISKAQHGFLKSHSTVTNLMEALNDWTSCLDHKKSVRILYVDFAKAFDSVSSSKLLIKLKGFGIEGLLLSGIKSFLTNRHQRVKVGRVLSSVLTVISGVPQGSVLGPFLFLLFINDLPSLIEEQVVSKLFADDLKAYSLDDYCSNPQSIQAGLDALNDWAKTWQLKLAVSKCGSLTLNGSPSLLFPDNLLLDDKLLPVLTSVSDLGVTIDCNLKFSIHINGIISKAKQRIYLLFKSFFTRNIALMVTAYKTYVLPILEYCSSIWSPSNLGDIDRIEDVQRFFTKRLVGLWHCSYENRLIACSLSSLELRRLHNDLILCYKIVHKLICLNFSDFFETDANTRTRGHNSKLRLPLCYSSKRRNFFSVRVVPVWNALPFKLVNVESERRFKVELRQIDLSRFLKRSYDCFV